MVTTTKTKVQIVVAGAVVFKDNQVLLTRRHQPELPGAHGRWEIPAGKVELGEDPHLTAEREVLEETGFEVEADPKRCAVKQMTWNFPEKECHTILIAYLAKFVGGTRKIEGGKVLDAKWWPVDSLPLDNILPLDDELIFELIS